VHRVAPLPVTSTGPVSLHQYLEQAREGERGEERYYTEDGRAASEWRTSPGLEIGGPVTAGQFVRLLDGDDPVTGVDRLDERSARRRLAGWSGVLAAPPEVSFLIHHGGGHCLADGRDVGDVARGCWEGAVAEALAGIEARLGTRAGAAGSTRLDAVGWQVALFRHETNRDGWLHSHVHYILPNCVQGSDGVWRTVDSRRLIPVQKVIGAELQAALRRRFGNELGIAYDLTRAKDGIVPAVGVDDRYVQARSSRRRAIGRYLAEHREALAERGIVGRRAELYAERATRAPKDTTVPIEQLRVQERDRLGALGVDIDAAVRGLVGRAVERIVEPDEVKWGLFERLAGPDGLTGHRAVFAERDVPVECLAAAPTPNDAEVWAKEFIDGWALPARAPSGESADRWFTTVSLVDAQDRLRAAWGKLDRGRTLVSDRAVDVALDRLAARGVVPSRAQEAAVRAVC
jgi:conjugative relaxase-like TrwC/TraI family protein